MNDEVKEILIDLFKHNKANRGDRKLADLAARAKKALDDYSRTKNKASSAVYPFNIYLEEYQLELDLDLKHEHEW